MKLSQQIYGQEFNRLKKLTKRENPNLTDREAATRAHARHPVIDRYAEKFAFLPLGFAAIYIR